MPTKDEFPSIETEEYDGGLPDESVEGLNRAQVTEHEGPAITFDDVTAPFIPDDTQPFVEGVLELDVRPSASASGGAGTEAHPDDDWDPFAPAEQTDGSVHGPDDEEAEEGELMDEEGHEPTYDLGRAAHQQEAPAAQEGPGYTPLGAQARWSSSQETTAPRLSAEVLARVAERRGEARYVPTETVNVIFKHTKGTTPSVGTVSNISYTGAKVSGPPHVRPGLHYGDPISMIVTHHTPGSPESLDGLSLRGRVIRIESTSKAYTIHLTLDPVHSTQEETLTGYILKLARNELI